MRAFSLFSGVGGFDLGMERAGFQIIGQCEIDAFRRTILNRHWPEVPCHDDVQSLHPPDNIELLFGGFPCQDLSVAGRRAGLEGSRSGLFYEFCRVADECVTSGGWILIENVPGFFSSPGKDRKGEDFGLALRHLGELGFHDLAWRVLDSRYFGVPQRRRRVFILARRARGHRAATVLLEPEGGGGHPEEGRQKGSRNRRTAVAKPASASDGRRGVPDRPSSSATPGGDTSHALTAEGFDASEDGTGRGTPIVADPLVSRSSRGRPQPNSPGHNADRNLVDEPMVASALDRMRGGADDNDAQANHIVGVGMGAADAEVSGTLGARGASGGQTTDVDRAGAYVLVFNPQSGGDVRLSIREGDYTDALIKEQTPAVWVAAPLTKGSAAGKGVSVPGRRKEDDENLVPAVTSKWSKGSGGPAGDECQNIVRAIDARNMREDDLAKTLLGGEHQSYSLNNMSIIYLDDVSGPLTKRQGKGINTTMDDGAMVVQRATAIVENQRAEVWEKPYAQQVTTGGGKVGQGYNAARIEGEDGAEGLVRRLTPTECERLQGFPDGWTIDYGPSLAGWPSWYQFPFRFVASPREPKPDGRRYAAMGDAVTAPVAEWIGRRIMQYGLEDDAGN